LENQSRAASFLAKRVVESITGG